MPKQTTYVEGTLRQRSDGRWEYRVNVAPAGMDPDRRSFYGKTGPAAKKAYRAYMDNRTAEEERRAELRRRQREKTVQEWGDFWLETYKKGKIAPKNYTNYKLYLERHIYPSLGSLMLSDVLPYHIEALYAAKRKMSKSALNYIKICLRGLFRSAVKNNLCDKDPSEDISPPKKLPPAPKVFSRDDVAALLDYCPSHRYGYYVEALLYTGLRIGELCALTWNDVDLEAGTLTISKTLAVAERVAGQKGRIYEVKDSTKTGHARTVVLDAVGIALFRTIPRTGIYLFTSKKYAFATPDMFRHRYDKVFDEMEADTGKSIPRLSPHKCRHTYATYLLNGGANIRAVQDQLGHAKITTTEIYTHIDLDTLRENVSKLSYQKPSSAGKPFSDSGVKQG